MTFRNVSSINENMLVVGLQQLAQQTAERAEMRVYGKHTACFLSSKMQTVATSSCSKENTLCRELGLQFYF